MTDPVITVTDNPGKNRYEIHVNGELAGFTTYRLRPDHISFMHTETFDAFAGHGLASHLARAVLDDARKRGLRVVAICPFVARYIAEHPDYQELLTREPGE